MGAYISLAWDFIRTAPWRYEAWWLNLLKESPQHVAIETTLLMFIIWLLFIRKTVDVKKATPQEKLSNKEIEWLLESWQPDDLVPSLSEKESLVVSNQIIVDSHKSDQYLQIRGQDKPVLNACSFDFYNFSTNEDVRECVTAALNKYGCGSCGPRGFYGTIDQHLILEKALADFMGAEEAICYSDGASAVYSVIPAYAKKGDLLLIDEACYEPIMTGADLSRATVRTYKHNDMKDLESKMAAIVEEDRKLKRDALQQRRFIVTESIFHNTGEMVPLPELMRVKEKYCYRLILDETLGFGVVGKTGRGVTEHFGIGRDRIEILTFTLDTAIASVGGVCVGTHQIVDHQRLSGAGYCFSASSAPFLCAAAIESLKKIEQTPALIEQLSKNSAKLYSSLSNIKGLRLLSPEPSHVIHLTLTKPCANVVDDVVILQKIVNECLRQGVAVATGKFSVIEATAHDRPSLMVTSNINLTDKKIEAITSALSNAANQFAPKA